MSESQLKERSASDYLGMLKALLPRGRAWTTDPRSVLSNLLGAASEELERLDAHIHLLTDETNPASTQEAIEDYERMLGLPDGCLPAGDSLQERREAVLARLNDNGGQTLEYWKQLAETISHDITLEEHWPFVCGVHECFDPSGLTEEEAQNYPEAGYLGLEDVRYWLNVIVHGDRLVMFRCGESECGESLMDWSEASSLECLMRRDMHAHVLLTFEYREDEVEGG